MEKNIETKDKKNKKEMRKQKKEKKRTPGWDESLLLAQFCFPPPPQSRAAH
jgi:hypothetical protein